MELCNLQDMIWYMICHPTKKLVFVYQQPPPSAGSIELKRPFPLNCKQWSSASTWAHTITTARPLWCASCMMLTALSIVIPGITFISTCTTYSRLLKLSLCSKTRNGGDVFRDFLVESMWSKIWSYPFGFKHLMKGTNNKDKSKHKHKDGTCFHKWTCLLHSCNSFPVTSEGNSLISWINNTVDH